VWYWVPGFLFTALSMFNWVCWIAPNNVVVNTLFGTNTGLGMGLLTFDWSMITYIGSPLVTPWWSELNTTAALVICFWFITPILYFTNTFYSKYMPISTFTIYDNTGQPYNVSAVITDDRFDEEKYKQYSPMYVSTVLAMYWAVAFAAFTSVVVHTFLWFRRDIARRLRNTIKDERDFHSRLMRAYPEVPHWWYICVGVPSFALLFAAIETYPTDLPIWGAVVGVVLALILALPSAILRAITNQLVVTNVLAEMMAGYLFPGRPVANMIFKSIVIMGTAQPVTFAGDLKLGHYMKVPPRMMFIVQLAAALISCFLVLGVQQWMFAHVVDFCAPDQPNGFVCYPTRFFATASFIWGGVGPARLFSPGSMYHPLLYFFLIGAILPVPFYFLARRYPLSFWRYVNIPVFFSGVGILLPATGMNYASWAITGFIFNYFIRRYHFRWWMRYNYILSAALDAGVGLALVFIFFCVQYPTNGFTINWWGNTVWQKTADALGTPLITLQQGQTFGPTTWS
jgi:OPT family small oligopeptide transporter